ncbi:MAG TPA: YafY family protein [Bradyrhizobium sp.]|nr:YafY family protein [Bradyrhizobium sp.]
MRRADRLFDIIQMLRVAPQPITAAAIAERLEVTVRTVYRDIATLQARRIPIEGAPGLGYLLRRGFDLPPLMFTADEIDAIAVGARLVRRLRDSGLQNAAESVLDKVSTVLPDAPRNGITEPAFLVSSGSAAIPDGIDLSKLRRAIRETRKMRIEYSDAETKRSERVIWPIAMAYYVDVTVLGAWCELRNDFRHFRVERIISSRILDDQIPENSHHLTRRWFTLQREKISDA